MRFTVIMGKTQISKQMEEFIIIQRKNVLNLNLKQLTINLVVRLEFFIN